MFKNILKFLGIGIGIAVLGLGVVYGVQYLQYRHSPEYKAVQDWENLKKKYAEDTFGGDTPEETLRLFVEALKKGDTDLAAKYFVLDKQQEWREDLAKIKEKNLLDETISDLGKLKLSKKTKEKTFFSLVNEDGIGTNVILYKNPTNNKWKIGEF